jgi:hypothetical protein
MTSARRSITGVFAVLLMLAFSSCSALLPGKAPADLPQADISDKPSLQETAGDIDDSGVKAMLGEYFTKLFSVPSVDKYLENTREGIIPDSIRGYVAKKTLEEGEKNPEIGIHLPRFISINGLTMLGYDIVKEGDENAGPAVTSGLVGRNGDNLLYFCKVTLKAKCVPDSVFDAAYTRNADNSYEKTGGLDESLSDEIKVQIKYDVEVIKEGDRFKILRAVESNIKPGYKNRLFTMNNESVSRVPFLNTARKPDGQSYVNEADGTVYEKEKSVITELFENLKYLDAERMNLLSYRWKNGAFDIRAFLDTAAILKGKDNRELMALESDYAQKLPFDSLPLQINMERIKTIKNLSIVPHPGYSQKQKRYMVSFDADVQKINGITDEDIPYRYSYFVSLSGEGDPTVVSSIKLNEYYMADPRKVN